MNRVDLVRRAWQKLESFLTGYPDDPAADQAAFAAANAQLELKAYADAAPPVTATPAAIPRATCWIPTGT